MSTTFCQQVMGGGLPQSSKQCPFWQQSCYFSQPAAHWSVYHSCQLSWQRGYGSNPRQQSHRLLLETQAHFSRILLNLLSVFVWFSVPWDCYFRNSVKFYMCFLIEEFPTSSCCHTGSPSKGSLSGSFIDQSILWITKWIMQNSVFLNFVGRRTPSFFQEHPV